MPMRDPTEERIRRAQRAEQILADPLMVEAKAHIEAELWRVIQETPPDKPEALQHVAQMRYMHGKYFAFLASAVQDGKFAKLELERKKKGLRERFLG